MNEADRFLRDKAAKVEVALAGYVTSWRNAPKSFVEAISYSLLGGGKRLRPALALGAAEIVAGRDDMAMPAACAIEMIHCYSLIHDDLPAMDDDDLRRGKPTLHKVCGEANAILAGDALIAMAFDAAAECGDARVVGEIARASGVSGMAGGQYLDLEAEGRAITIEELRHIHAWKTGALIRASVRSGAMLGGADAAALEALTAYGELIGLAFQIADDVLDVAGTEEKIGKPVGSDAANAKATYPALLGLDESRRLAQKAADDAVAALARFGHEANAFRALAKFIVERDN